MSNCCCWNRMDWNTVDEEGDRPIMMALKINEVGEDFQYEHHHH